MDKSVFRNLVFPLNQREEFYLSHPDQRNPYQGKTGSFYTSDETGLVHLHLNIGIKEQGNLNQHSVFFDGQLIQQEMLQLPVFFNKQTRFSEVPLHVRDYLELKYVYAGTCTAVLDGQQVPLETGDMLLLDRGSAHRILPTGRDDLVFNFLMERSYFTRSFINRFSGGDIIANFLANSINDSATHDAYLLFRTHNNPTLRELVESVLCEYLDPGVCASTVIESYLMLIFIEILRCYKHEMERSCHERKKSYITEVLEYIRHNCNDCTLQNTARHFNYNPDYLSRNIKKATGQSFQSLIIQSRMERAAYLLTSTAEPIYQIAQECGYQNLHFFHQKFKEFFQCSPAEYRAARHLEG